MRKLLVVLVFSMMGIPAIASPIVGGWFGQNMGQAQSTMALTFLANGTFLLAEDGNPMLDPSGQDGMERGTYSWDAGTGAFSFAMLANTNGQWGLSHSAVSNIQVSGNTMTVTDGGDMFTLTRVANPANPIVGSWYASPAGEAQSEFVITFLSGGMFLVAEDGNPALDPSGQDGMERGTYAWNAMTGAFSNAMLTDTNGQWGLSHSTITSLLVNGNVMTMSDGGDSFQLQRVVAAVPEPSALLLLLAGLAGLGARRASRQSR